LVVKKTHFDGFLKKQFDKKLMNTFVLRRFVRSLTMKREKPKSFFSSSAKYTFLRQDLVHFVLPFFDRGRQKIHVLIFQETHTDKQAYHWNKVPSAN